MKRSVAITTLSIAVAVTCASCTTKMRLRGGVLAFTAASLNDVYDVVATPEGFAVLGFSSPTAEIAIETFTRLDARGALIATTPLEGYNHGLGFFGNDADFPMMTFLITDTNAATAYARYKTDGGKIAVDTTTATGWIEGIPVVSARRVTATSSLWLAGLRYSDTGQLDLVVTDTAKTQPMFSYQTSDPNVASITGGALAEAGGKVFMAHTVSVLSPTSTTDYDSNVYITPMTPGDSTPANSTIVGGSTGRGTVALEGFWAAPSALYFMARSESGPIVRKLLPATLEPDSSYGNNGYLDPQAPISINGKTFYLDAQRADLDPQGRLVVCGMAKESDAGAPRLALWRFLATGVLETSLGGANVPYLVVTGDAAHCVRVRAGASNAVILFDEGTEAPSIWKVIKIPTL